MIQTIRIERVLREAVTTPYSVLVTRSTGAAVRARIEEVLAGSPFEAALLDFSAVELLDFSCADEVVAKLLLTDAVRQRFFFLLRVHCADQREAIDHVLGRQDLAVAAVGPAGPPDVLGRLSDDLRTAFTRLCTVGPSDIPGLAADLGWPLPRAADALAGLVRRRLARPAGPVHHPLPLPPA